MNMLQTQHNQEHKLHYGQMHTYQKNTDNFKQIQL